MSGSDKKIDNRVWNGGARENAGRPPYTLPKEMDDFLNEIIVVKELRTAIRNGKPYLQLRRIKKTRYAHMLHSHLKYEPFKKGNKRLTNYLLKIGMVSEWGSPRKKKPKEDITLIELKRSAEKEEEWQKAIEKGRKIVSEATGIPPTQNILAKDSGFKSSESNISEEQFRRIMGKNRRQK